MVRDAKTLLHASATHMAVVMEPIVPALPRIRALAGDITGVRRLPARS